MTATTWKLEMIAEAAKETGHLNTEIDTEAMQMAITLKPEHYIWEGQDLLKILARCQAYGLMANIITDCETRTPMVTIAKRYTNK